MKTDKKLKIKPFIIYFKIDKSYTKTIVNASHNYAIYLYTDAYLRVIRK